MRARRGDCPVGGSPTAPSAVPRLPRRRFSECPAGGSPSAAPAALRERRRQVAGCSGRPFPAAPADSSPADPGDHYSAYSTGEERPP
jgi:hypothetical protein